MYNSVHDDVNMNHVYNRLSAASVSEITKASLIDINDVLSVHVKAYSWPWGGINMEAFIYSALRLRIIDLYLLFNTCILHIAWLSASFFHGV